MKGKEFETAFCKILKSLGYWALNIPKNQSGAQPFDVIALKNNDTLAVDCKVCGKGAFQLSRIEPNQWTAFQSLRLRCSTARIGIVALYNGDIYYIPYNFLADCKSHDLNTIAFANYPKMMDSVSIKNLIGRTLE